jgi:hypothetical protein
LDMMNAPWSLSSAFRLLVSECLLSDAGVELVMG